MRLGLVFAELALLGAAFYAGIIAADAARAVFFGACALYTQANRISLGSE